MLSAPKLSSSVIAETNSASARSRGGPLARGAATASPTIATVSHAKGHPSGVSAIHRAATCHPRATTPGLPRAKSLGSLRAGGAAPAQPAGTSQRSVELKCARRCAA